MGQQQLLLVILVTIIVGIATVVAINTFGTAADVANVDSVHQDVASFAAAAQSYYMKPQMLGGGGRSFQNITFNDVPFASQGVEGGTTAWNINGKYVIADASATQITLEAHPASRIPGGISDQATTAPEDASLSDGALTAYICASRLTWETPCAN
jgi:hypothetical protein